MNNLLASVIYIFLILSANLIANDPYPWRHEGICKEFKDRPLDLIAAFISKEPVIFEAGAHYGSSTIKMSYKWPKGKIICFEPNPSGYEKLLELSSYRDNIFPYPLAVSDFNGVMPFYICYGSNGNDAKFEGASSLLPASEQMKIHYRGPQIFVDSIILDEWCRVNNIESIEFMWLDMEGMELQTLKSSQNILKTVKCIYTETNFQEFRQGMTQYAELRRFLEESGFYLLAHWYQENLQGNAIFIRESKIR